MLIYNTYSRQKEKFIPIKENIVKIYVCGPTVYDNAHLGHARSAIVFDLLRRVLIELGYKVEFVKNFTDIDDKIIKKMKETNKSLKEITSYYIKSYLDDMKSLNVLRADFEPHATKYINDIIEFIQILIDKKCAYITDDGIYFDTSKDKEYFSLSHKQNDIGITQDRVKIDEKKRDPKDFALWKFIHDDELTYKSPFGDGRPGWHIECSTMINSYLAYKNEKYQIDIHGGGADLIFPHHENEAAQTRCYANKSLAKYWMHNGFVQIDGEKMSKSLGNSFFLKDALKSYDGEVIRFYLLSTHYRANFNFNENDLLASKKRLDKLYRLKKRLLNIKASTVNKKFKQNILSQMSDDLNISTTLAKVDEMINSANEKLDKEPKNKIFKKEIVANLEFLQNLLGIGYKDAYEYFQSGVTQKEKEKIESLLKKRFHAKKERDFKTADKIRDELLGMNIKIMDTPTKTLWEKSE